jgi:hypothetical protein
MNIKLEHIEPEGFSQLQNAWNSARKDDLLPKEIASEEDVEAMMRLLYLIQNNDESILGPLREIGAIKEIDSVEPSEFERSILTIARHDHIDKLLAPKDDNKKKWMATRLSTYLSYFVSADNKSRVEVAAKNLYNKYRKMFTMRLSRLKSSPKVVELINKHPDVDVYSLVALGIISDKIDLTHDDLLWIDRMITIFKTKP